MEAEDFANKIFEIKSLLEENEGVALFASHKSRSGKVFENWLKVELCGILSHYGKVLPEVSDAKKKIDIVFNDDNNEWAISLKDRKKRGINVLDNLKELKKAPYNKYKKTCLVFLTFSPFGKKIRYDTSITRELNDKKIIPRIEEFKFKNTVFKYNNEGRIWFVLG